MMMSDVEHEGRGAGGAWIGRRWQSWAQALAGRYGHAAGRWRSLPLTWLEAIAPGRTIVQHWHQIAQTLSPRLHLTIGPIVVPGFGPVTAATGPGRPASWGPTTLVAPARQGAVPVAGALAPGLRLGLVWLDAAVAASRDGGSGRDDRRPGRLAWDGAVQLLPSGQRPGAAWQPSFISPTALPGQSAATGMPRRRRDAPMTITPPATVWLTPMGRSLAQHMVEEREETETLSRVRLDRHLGERRLRLHRRLVQEHRRIELRASRTLLVRQPSRQPVVVNIPDGLVPARGSEAASATSRPAAPTPLATIDVQRLTDQVVRQLDRRLVAYRERQGRAF